MEGQFQGQHDIKCQSHMLTVKNFHMAYQKKQSGGQKNVKEWLSGNP